MSAEVEIIYEDEDFLAINKPAGMLVYSTSDKEPAVAKATADEQAANKSSTVVSWLLKRYPAIKTVGDDPKTRPGIVHRLDRDTSGVMIIAKNQEYFCYLKSLFKNREIKKVYLALVWGLVKSGKGVIEKPIGIKSGTLKRSVHSEKMAKAAITEFRTLKYLDKKATLLQVFPVTGRTHQIRVHLASIGHPVVGDRLYGSKKLESGAFQLGAACRLMLHAYSLEFSTKDGKRIKIESDLPPDFKKLTDFADSF